MPGLAAVIKNNDKPASFSILCAVADILGIDKLEIMGIKKDNHIVDARVIFAILTILIHDPQRLIDNKKSVIIPIIANILSRDTNTIDHYIKMHNNYMKCNSKYRTKFNYVSEAITQWQ
jgi:hypothetical protein